jgi:hypothetical protein
MQYFNKIDRDAFDALFDHAPEKLSLVKNVTNSKAYNLKLELLFIY